MKRLDLVQLTIIIVGIFSAFFFLLALPQLLVVFYDWFRDGLSGNYISSFLSIVVIDASYLLFSIYCFAKSKHFAEWISNKANLNSDINFALDKAELLFVVFVGLGIYGLITRVPAFVVGIFKMIKDHNSHVEVDTLGATGNANLVVNGITIFGFFVLTYYAKIFADFFAAKINNIEPEDEIAAKTEE
ncbi:hypothetical protein [Ferruginibacter sp.]